MPEHLSLKLSLLREEYKAEDSAEQLDSLESELSRLFDAKTDLNLPAFKQIAQRARTKANAIDALLMNDVTLLNDAGLRLSQERDMWRAVLATFGIEETDTAIKMLTDLIEDKLPHHDAI